MKQLIIFLLLGAAHMGLAVLFNVHEGLDHMDYSTMTYPWMGYTGEALFYSICWAAIYYWWKNSAVPLPNEQ